MIGNRARVGVGIAVAVLAVVLLLAAVSRLTSWGGAAARPGSDDCASVSAGDQQALLWLTQLRQTDGLPLSEISLAPCESDTRTGATALVDVGRSASVQDFFTARYHCDVKQSCLVSTHADAAELVAYLNFTAERGWSLIVRSPAAP
jgi:hypothetical protein